MRIIQTKIKHKKMRLLIYILLTLSVGLVSCSEKNNPRHNVFAKININMCELEERSILFFSDIFIRSAFVALCDSVPLGGQINRILLHNGEIFIIDSHTVGVHVFDKQGNYLRQIGSRGAGPSEMSSAFDMTIDRENNYIYIIDFHTQTIHKYDVVSGRFQKTIHLPEGARYSHIAYNNDIIFLTQYAEGKNGVSHLFRVMPMNGSDPYEIIPTSFNKGWSNFMVNTHGPFFFTSEGTVLLTHRFMDVIYKYANGQLKPYIALHGNENNFVAPSDLNDFHIIRGHEDVMRVASIQKYHNIHHYIESDDFIFFKVSKGLTRSVSILYNRKTGIAKRVGSFIEDIFFTKTDRVPFHYGGKQDVFIVLYAHLSDIDILLRMLDMGLIQDDEFRKFMESIGNVYNESFNGIILLYELK